MRTRVFFDRFNFVHCSRSVYDILSSEQVVNLQNDRAVFSATAIDTYGDAVLVLATIDIDNVSYGRAFVSISTRYPVLLSDSDLYDGTESMDVSRYPIVVISRAEEDIAVWAGTLDQLFTSERMRLFDLASKKVHREAEYLCKRWLKSKETV